MRASHASAVPAAFGAITQRFDALAPSSRASRPAPIDHRRGGPRPNNANARDEHRACVLRSYLSVAAIAPRLEPAPRSSRAVERERSAPLVPLADRASPSFRSELGTDRAINGPSVP